MNKPIRRVAIACLLLFVILLVNDNVVQYANAKTLRDKPGNTRLLFQQYDRKRGDIVTATGVTIASSVPTNDTLKYLRRYSNGPLFAPVTGFYSIVYNASQIELAENSILAGTDDRLFGVQQLSNLITGRTPEGGNVVLTIDPVLQQVAYTALAGRKGAVVAVDPSTGAILAMVTSPSYDPNVLSSHNTTSITQDWQKLIADQANNPMLDRALNQTYPPGSTFKLITAAAALSTGQYTPTTVIPAPATLPLPQSTSVLHNFQGESCGGQATLIQALTISCNTAFGELGLTIGQSALQAQADAFGFDSTYSVPMKSAQSVFPDRPLRREHDPVRDRAVRRARDATADGDGGRCYRQRWGGNEALPGRRAGRARSADHRPDQARRTAARGLGPGGRRAHPDDGECCSARNRHECTDQGCHGGR